MSEQTFIDETEALEALEVQIEEDGQGLTHALEQADYLFSLESRILETGEVDRTTMRSLETAFPGCIHSEYPINAFTQEASGQHLDASLESLSSAAQRVFEFIKKALSKILKSISDFIAKLLGRNDGKMESSKKKQESTAQDTTDAIKDASLDRDEVDQELVDRAMKVASKIGHGMTSSDDRWMKDLLKTMIDSDGDAETIAKAYVQAFYESEKSICSERGQEIRKMAFTASPSMEAITSIAETSKAHQQSLLATLDLMEEAVGHYSEAYDEEKQSDIASLLNKAIEALSKAERWFGDSQRPSQVYEQVHSYWGVIHGESLPNGSNFMGVVKEHNCLDTQEFYSEFIPYRDSLGKHDLVSMVEDFHDEVTRRGIDTKFLGEIKDRGGALIKTFDSVESKKQSLKPQEPTEDEDGRLVIDMGDGNAVSGRVIELEKEFMNRFRDVASNLWTEHRSMAGLVGYQDIVRTIGITVNLRMTTLETNLQKLIEVFES